MKKILILTAGFGEGHNAAARGLREALESLGPALAEVKMIDPLELAYGRINGFAKRAYRATIERAPAVWREIYSLIDSGSAFQDSIALFGPLQTTLKRLLETESPDVVVSTYPIFGYFIDEIFCRADRLPFRRFTVITDSISVNSIWFRCESDAFLVPNEETAVVLVENGIPPEKIGSLGFPVSPRFSQMEGAKDGPPPGERWRVLYLINSARSSEAIELIRELLAINEVDLTVAVGRDEDLRASVESAIAESGRNATVHGWTDQMPELIGRAHLLISKAGGATVQESLAARTPLIITQILPGQEEGNAELILCNRCGAYAPTVGEVVATVKDAIAGNGLIWRQWQANLQPLSRPDAAHAVAKFILL